MRTSPRISSLGNHKPWRSWEITKSGHKVWCSSIKHSIFSNIVKCHTKTTLGMRQVKDHVWPAFFKSVSAILQSTYVIYDSPTWFRHKVPYKSISTNRYTDTHETFRTERSGESRRDCYYWYCGLQRDWDQSRPEVTHSTVLGKYPKDVGYIRTKLIHKCPGFRVLSQNIVVQYETIRWELNKRLIFECRCDERLKSKMRDLHVSDTLQTLFKMKR